MPIEVPFVLLLIGMVVTAAAAVEARGHIIAVLILSIFGIFSTLVFAFLQAVDVAMAEAVIGAGLMTALFVTAISKTRRQR